MGNDGGTIAKRKDLISLHSLNENSPTTGEDNETTLLVTCGISSLPLNSGPVVGDWRGHLYLKEKAIEHILKQKVKSGESNANTGSDSQQSPSNSSHKRSASFTSLNDLVDVSVTWGKENGLPVLTCPVTQEVNTGNFTFAYLRPCGCLISYRILLELGKALKVGKEPVKSECPNCGKIFYYNFDIVILNPLNNVKHSAFNLDGITHLKKEGLLHSKKKDKKRANKDEGSKKKKRKVDVKDVPKSVEVAGSTVTGTGK